MSESLSNFDIQMISTSTSLIYWILFSYFFSFLLLLLFLLIFLIIFTYLFYLYAFYLSLSLQKLFLVFLKLGNIFGHVLLYRYELLPSFPLQTLTIILPLKGKFMIIIFFFHLVSSPYHSSKLLSKHILLSFHIPIREINSILVNYNVFLNRVMKYFVMVI